MKLLLTLTCAIALSFAAAIGLNATSAPQRLPALPDSIPSQLGWITVHRVPRLMCNDAPAYGCFEYATRTLSIADSLAPSLAWMALEHERVHVILFDADTHPATAAQEDHLADVLASARVLELLAAPRR